MSASIRLCLSTKLLLHGDSAAVVLMTMPKVSHMLLNSLPLSVWNLTSDSNIDTQLLKMYLMIICGCLFGMTTDAESLVQWSAIFYLHSNSAPLPQFPEMCWTTTGLGGGFLYILHVGHNLETSFTSFIGSFLLDHNGPALVMRWSNLSWLG